MKFYDLKRRKQSKEGSPKTSPSKSSSAHAPECADTGAGGGGAASPAAAVTHLGERESELLRALHAGNTSSDGSNSDGSESGTAYDVDDSSPLIRRGSKSK